MKALSVHGGAAVLASISTNLGRRTQKGPWGSDARGIGTARGFDGAWFADMLPRPSVWWSYGSGESRGDESVEAMWIDPDACDVLRLIITCFTRPLHRSPRSSLKCSGNTVEEHSDGCRVRCRGSASLRVERRDRSRLACDEEEEVRRAVLMAASSACLDRSSVRPVAVGTKGRWRVRVGARRLLVVFASLPPGTETRQQRDVVRAFRRRRLPVGLTSSCRHTRRFAQTQADSDRRSQGDGQSPLGAGGRARRAGEGACRRRRSTRCGLEGRRRRGCTAVGQSGSQRVGRRGRKGVRNRAARAVDGSYIGGSSAP